MAVWVVVVVLGLGAIGRGRRPDATPTTSSRRCVSSPSSATPSPARSAGSRPTRVASATTSSGRSPPRRDRRHVLRPPDRPVFLTRERPGICAHLLLSFIVRVVGAEVTVGCDPLSRRKGIPMPSLGPAEILVILVIALLVFGPEQDARDRQAGRPGLPRVPAGAAAPEERAARRRLRVRPHLAAPRQLGRQAASPSFRRKDATATTAGEPAPASAGGRSRGPCRAGSARRSPPPRLPHGPTRSADASRASRTASNPRPSR